MMDRVQGEPFGVGCSLFADELAGHEALEGLQPSPEAVGADEVCEAFSELFVVVVGETFGGRLLDRAVHAFDLANHAGMPDLGESMLDPMLAAYPAKGVLQEECPNAWWKSGDLERGQGMIRRPRRAA